MSDKIAVGRMNLHERGALVTFRKRRWDNKVDFHMVMLAAILGFPNYCIFPVGCFYNGGWMFIVIYFIVVCIIEAPLYYMELGMGQFSGKGAIHMYNSLGEGWRGLGIMQCICCIYASSYNAYIIALTLFYCLQSFAEELPWLKCVPEWNVNCTVSFKKSLWCNGTRLSSDIYFEKEVLGRINLNKNGFGNADLRLIICAFFTWEMVFLNCIVGIKSQAKFSYFTVIYPMIICFGIILKACTMSGLSVGMNAMFQTNYKLLMNMKVWWKCLSHSFISLCTGYGVVSNYASYNYMDTNIMRCTWFVIIFDTFFSILSTLGLFLTAGHIAYENKRDIRDFIDNKSHPFHLIFVIYSAMLAEFATYAWLMSIIFYSSLYCVGIGSLISLTQVLNTNAMELFPELKEWHCSLITAVLGFGTTIMYCTNGGFDLMIVVTQFGTDKLISLNAFLATIAVFYSRGLTFYCWDVEFITTTVTNLFWRWSWSVTGPLIIAANYIYTNFIAVHSEEVKPKRITVHLFACALIITSLLPLPITMIKSFLRNKGSGCAHAFRQSFSSTRWLPFTDDDKLDYEEFKEDKLRTFAAKNKSPGYKFFYSLTHRK